MWNKVVRFDTAVMSDKTTDERPRVDMRYPAWARRSNPIVRRHLGVYAKTMPPQFGQLFNLFLIQAVIILLTVPMPFIFNITLPLITVSIILLPVTFYYYGQILLFVAMDAPVVMLQETRNNTLNLLRTTPFTSHEILLGKISAVLWRRIEDLNLILFSATVFGLPAIVMLFANLWSPEEYPLLSQVAIIIVFGASIARALLEPFMIAALGVMVGAAVPLRSTAITATILLSAFYFILINLARLLPLSLPMRVLVEGILPVVLPALIGWGALQMAIHFMSRD